MGEQAHTPTPWRVDPELGSESVMRGRSLVADCCITSIRAGDLSPRNQANAAFIVQAANSYASHLALIKSLTEALDRIKFYGELACVDVPHFTGGSSGKKPPSKDVWQFPRHMLPDIDEAIALGRAALTQAAPIAGKESK